MWLLLVSTLPAHAFYNPSTGRWLSRDPIGENGEKNLYGFVQNDSVRGVDPVGLCKVYSSGFRYRVNIAGLDAFQVGTPYADLANVAKGAIDRMPQYSAADMVAPNFATAGPFTFSNPELNGGNIPAGTFVGAHYLFYADWEIDESDGPCGLNLTDDATHAFTDGSPPMPPKYYKGPAPLGSSKVAGRKQSVGACNKTLIFVDAPGSRAHLKQSPVITIPISGFTVTVKQQFEVINTRTKSVVHTSSHVVTIGLDEKGSLIATP